MVWSTDSCRNLGGPWKYVLLSERSQTQRTTAPCDFTPVIHRDRIRRADARGWKEGRRGVTADGDWLRGSLSNVYFPVGHTQPPAFRNCRHNFSPALRDHLKLRNQHKAQWWKKYGNKWTEKRQCFQGESWTRRQRLSGPLCACLQETGQELRVLTRGYRCTSAGRLKHASLQRWGLTVFGRLPWWECSQERQPPHSDGQACRAVSGDMWAEISHVCAAERLLADSASYFTRNYEALAVFFLAPGNKRFHTAKTSYNLLPRVLRGWEISIKRWGMRRSASLRTGKHILLLFPYL